MIQDKKKVEKEFFYGCLRESTTNRAKVDTLVEGVNHALNLASKTKRVGGDSKFTNILVVPKRPLGPSTVYSRKYVLQR